MKRGAGAQPGRINEEYRILLSEEDRRGLEIGVREVFAVQEANGVNQTQDPVDDKLSPGFLGECFEGGGGAGEKRLEAVVAHRG